MYTTENTKFFVCKTSRIFHVRNAFQWWLMRTWWYMHHCKRIYVLAMSIWYVVCQIILHVYIQIYNPFFVTYTCGGGFNRNWDPSRKFHLNTIIVAAVSKKVYLCMCVYVYHIKISPKLHWLLQFQNLWCVWKRRASGPAIWWWGQQNLCPEYIANNSIKQ